MVAMNLNTGTYKLASSASSASITLTPQDANCMSLVLYNSDTTYPVFVVSGKGAVTAALPASATVSVQGKMVGPGATHTFTKNAFDETIAAISTGAGSGALWVSPGAGE